MDFLGPASDDEHRDVTGIQNTGMRNVNATNIEDATIRLEAGGGVLLGKGSVDVVLSIREPKLQSLNVSLDVGIEDFGEHVIAHFPQERLHLEVGIDLPELLDDLSGLVLSEEASNLVGYAAGCTDKGVLGLVIGFLHAEELLHHGIGVLEVTPRVLPGSVLVDGDVGTSAGGKSVRHVPIGHGIIKTYFGSSIIWST